MASASSVCLICIPGPLFSLWLLAFALIALCLVSLGSISVRGRCLLHVLLQKLSIADGLSCGAAHRIKMGMLAWMRVTYCCSMSL